MNLRTLEPSLKLVFFELIPFNMDFISPSNYTNLGSAEDIQNRVFGEYTTKDMSDYSQLAYSALMKEQEQAYQTAMYNYNNWYNSDAQRMQRRLAAGLNPYGLEGSPAAAAASAPSAPVARSTGTAAKGVQSVSAIMQNVIGTLSQAREIYDLLSFKGPLSEQQRRLAFEQTSLAGRRSAAQEYENQFSQYLLGLPEFSHLASSPRAQRYQAETDVVNSRIAQLEYLINELYPSQKDRNEALKALDAYRYLLMNGMYGAILDINTGNKSADGVMKLFGLWLRDSLHL